MIAEHTQTVTEAPIVLQCVDLCKCYNGVVQASDHINFTLRRGEVHAFLGENGAGKSTLMKMLYGIEQPDEGQMFLSGEPVVLKSPADAIAHGIGMVHQELMLIPHLTVAENITLGQEVRTRSGRLKKQEASHSIRELAASYGLDIDPDALVDKLTIGQRQRVEIVKLLYRKADILIFDEPTALLTPQESDALFDVLRRLRELGKSTIFITHKLREVYQIADRMTVIRQGRIIGTTTPQETGMEKLTQMMVGRAVVVSYRQLVCDLRAGSACLRKTIPAHLPCRHCFICFILFIRKHLDYSLIYLCGIFEEFLLKLLYLKCIPYKKCKLHKLFIGIENLKSNIISILGLFGLHLVLFLSLISYKQLYCGVYRLFPYAFGYIKLQKLSRSASAFGYKQGLILFFNVPCFYKLGNGIVYHKVIGYLFLLQNFIYLRLGKPGFYVLQQIANEYFYLYNISESAGLDSAVKNIIFH